MELGEMPELMRTRWTVEEIESAIEHAIANHATFIVKKKDRKMVDFWSLVGQSVGHSGEECERLFRNLMTEYRRVKQIWHMSGADSAARPELRHSHTMYTAFDNYCQIFQGCGSAYAATPAATETSFTVVQTRSESDVGVAPSSSPSSSRAASPAPDAMEDLEKPAVDDNPSELEGEETYVIVGTNIVKSSTKKKPSFSNEEYRRQKLCVENRRLNIESRRLNIENRKLQLKTSKIQLSRRKVEALEKICVEVETVRTMYAMVHGMEIVTAPTTVSSRHHPLNSRQISTTYRDRKRRK